MFSVFLFLAFYLIDSSESEEQPPTKVSYEGSEVWQTPLKNIDELNILRRMECSEDIQIWNIAAHKAQYLVKPNNMKKIKEQLLDNDLNYTVHINNTNQKICSMYTKTLAGPEKKGKSEINLNEEEGQNISWKSYPSWEVIRKYLIYIAKQNTAYVDLKSIGESSCERPIMTWPPGRIHDDLRGGSGSGADNGSDAFIGVFCLYRTHCRPAAAAAPLVVVYAASLTTILKISNNDPSNKPILIISGVHGQEWAAVITVIFILNSIATKFDSLPTFLQNKDWYFVPVLNPDGYHHTHHEDRFWRKNRRKVNGKIGVDLAFNFAKYWGKDETLPKDCPASYEGPSAFSEPETKALRDFVLEKIKAKRFQAFIDVQSYGQMIQYPWNAIPEKTKDNRAQVQVAHTMRQLIFNRTKTSFQFTSGYDVPYPRHGTSTDWAYSLGIIYSYVIKTRDTGEHGFLLPNKYMKDTAAEVLRAIKLLAVVLDGDATE